MLASPLPPSSGVAAVVAAASVAVFHKGCPVVIVGEAGGVPGEGLVAGALEAPRSSACNRVSMLDSNASTFCIA